MKNYEKFRIQNAEFRKMKVAQGREGATRICILLTQNTVVGCKATEKFRIKNSEFRNRKRGWGERGACGFSKAKLTLL